MMSDNISKRFIRGVGFNATGSIANIIFNFASLAIAVRVISKEQFGIFTLLYVIAYIFATIGDCGMQDTIVRFVASEKNRQRQIIASVLGIRLILSLIIILLILSFKKAICAIFHSQTLAGFIIFAPAMFFTQYLFVSLQGFLIGLHLYRRSAIVQIAGGFLRILLVLVFVLFLKWQLSGLLFSVIFSSLASCILAYTFLPWFIRPKIDFAILKRILRFGFPLQVNRILAVIYDRVGALMLGAMRSPLSVAVYEIGHKVPEGLKRIFHTFRQVYLSHISEFYGNGEKEHAQELVSISLRLTAFFTALLTLFVGLFHTRIITILFSQKYAESGIILFILMIGATIGLCNHLMNNVFIASGDPKKILVPSIVQSIVNVAGNLILIPLWGALGAACASLISIAFINPILLLLLEKGTRLKIAWSYLRSLLALAFSLCLLYLLGGEILGFKLLVIVVFCLMASIFKVLRKNEIFLLYNAIRPQRGR